MDAKSKTEYLATPPGKCCIQGFPHKGEPRGTHETIASVETYTVHNGTGQENGPVLLFFPDVTGMSLNNRLLMDAFANAGYDVLGLNYFQGVSSIPQGILWTC
jgi:hypothetical protein